MFKSISVLLTASILLFTATARGEVSFSYGNEKGQVAFINQNNHPGIEEPLPLGPLAFRKIGNLLFIADSVGGKVVKFDITSKLIQDISITATASNMLFDDIAVSEVDNGKSYRIWLIDALSNSILQFDEQGQLIGKLVSSKFVQPFRLELGSSGLVYVADKGAQMIFVFNSDARLLQEIPWEWTGMALSPDAEILYRLCYSSESNTSYLVSTNQEGKVTFEKELALGEHFNAEIWFVDEEKQECVITYSTTQAFERKLVMVKVGFDGVVKARKEFLPPFAMNRFVEKSGDDVWVADGDFSQAPEGIFKIKKIELPEIKE